jgi:hypothetical protein
MPQCTSLFFFILVTITEKYKRASHLSLVSIGLSQACGDGAIGVAGQT